ncbi:PLP-dependent transferase [Haloprofundus sp. MHR1]|uniref:PLP-dependent transferase n=1 Tax=Haloprofundus sp. MHR1 TaxID=2572921 RepID=UPI003742A5C3
MGNMLSPFDSYLVLRGTKTLPLRMRQHNENAMEVARFLEDQRPRAGGALPRPGEPPTARTGESADVGLRRRALGGTGRGPQRHRRVPRPPLGVSRSR